MGVMFYVSLFMAACSAGLGFIVGDVRRESIMQKEAIAAGYARHNPKTGKFEWLEDV